MSKLQEYLTKSKKEDSRKLAGVVTAVYETGSIQFIEKFQGMINLLEASALDGSLESRVNTFTSAQVSSPPKEKPVLDYKTYLTLREQGKSDEAILIDYRLNHPKSLASFRSGFTRSRRSSPQVEEKNDVVYPESGKPVLNYGTYCNLRNQGFDDKKILETYTLEKKGAITGFKSVYEREAKKKAAKS